MKDCSEYVGIKIMPGLRVVAVIALFMMVFSPDLLVAQAININDLFVDLTIVEKEEAAAKEVRLKWISTERERIRGEIQKYEKELGELRHMFPDPAKQHHLSPAVAKAQQLQKAAFHSWASNNDPALNAAVVRGSAINALLRVLGPIAHSRQLRKQIGAADVNFPSLTAANAILAADAPHFRMAPATSAGSNVVVRLNRLPLDLQLPVILVQQWPVECRDILKLRDEYVAILSLPAGIDTQKLVDRAEVLDSALELLQLMVVKQRRLTPHNVSLSARKKIEVHRDLQDALRYLETVRATTERFKNAPSEFRIHEFPGGTVEDFLDFCYTRGMIFQQARPDDQSDYFKVYRKIQDYAHDVQFLEDWKEDLQRRVDELNADDKNLIWHAASQ